MVFNATFNNISAISWQSVLLVEETGVPEKTEQPPLTSIMNTKNTITYGIGNPALVLGIQL
jgi:hypothetical protein